MFKAFIDIAMDPGCRLPDSVREVLGDVVIPAPDGRRKSHPHPILHVTRKIAEAKALDLATTIAGGGPHVRIVDIGGCVRGHVGRGNVHSMQPDHKRRPKQSPQFDFCDNRLSSYGDCSKCCGADVSVSVHSLYYFDPKELYDYMMQTWSQAHVAVLHDFARDFTPGERAEIVSLDITPESVSMAVNGNATAYRHPNPTLWLSFGELCGEGYRFFTRKCFDVESHLVMMIICQPLKTTISMPSIDFEQEVIKQAELLALAIDTTQFAANFNPFMMRLRNAMRCRGEAYGKWFDDYINADRAVDLFYGDQERQLDRLERVHGFGVRDTSLLTHELLRTHPDSMVSILGRLKMFYRRWQLGTLRVWDVVDVRATFRRVCAVGFFGCGLYVLHKAWVYGVAVVGDLLKSPASVFFDKEHCAYAVPDTCEYTPGDLGEGSFLKPRDLAPCLPRTAAINYHYLVSCVTPNYPRRCDHAVYSALVNRVLNARATNTLWLSMGLANFDALRVFCLVNYTDVDFSEWVGRYPLTRRKELVEARLELAFRCYDPEKFSTTTGFIKNEMASKAIVNAPRFISGREATYDAAIGPVVYAYSNLVARYFCVEFDIFYTCGASNEDKALWISDRALVGMYLYENDFSKFDSTVTDEAIEFECRLYQFLGMDSGTVDLIRTQKQSVGSVRGGWKYSTTGCRASGVQNTSLGNSLLNIQATQFSVAQACHIMVMGDDCVIATYQPLDVVAAAERFASLGLQSKLKAVTLDNVEFCSSIVYPVRDGYVMGPKIGRILARVCWDIKFTPERQRVQHLRSVFTGLYTQCHFIPVLQQFIARWATPSLERTEHKSFCAVVHETTLQTWVFLCERYSLPIEALESLASHLYTFTPPHVCNHSALLNIMQVDFYADGCSVFNCNSLFLVLVLSPILEEYIKSYHYILVLLIAVYESHSFYSFILKSITHSFFWLFPLPFSMILHFLFNLYVVCSTGSEKFYFSFIMANLKRRTKSKKGKKRSPKVDTTSPSSVVGAVRSAVKAALVGAGSAGGTYLGGPAGGALGGRIGAYLSRITGMGDYKVEKNSIFNGTPIPAFSNGHRRTIVRHREYCFDILGSTSFNLANYTINPTAATLFPWLSRLAGGYQQYKFHGLVFEFISTSGNATGANTSLGTVIMGANYNCVVPGPSTKAQVEQMEFTISTTPSTNAIFPVECDPSEQVTEYLYVSNYGTNDPRLTRMANFLIATTGQQQVGNVLGELWVSYEIELLKPTFGTPTSQISLINNNEIAYSAGASFSFENMFTLCPSRSSAYVYGPVALATQSITNDTFTFGDNVSGGYLVVEVYLANATNVITMPVAVLGPGLTLPGTTSGPWGPGAFYNSASGDTMFRPSSYVPGSTSGGCDPGSMAGAMFGIIVKINSLGNKYLRFYGGSVPTNTGALVKIRYIGTL